MKHKFFLRSSYILSLDVFCRMKMHSQPWPTASLPRRSRQASFTLTPRCKLQKACAHVLSTSTHHHWLAKWRYAV